ncbi:MAG: wax ester/triacylglycerol synthase family O-acyltransferase, partial [Chloroflexota bacterium]
MAMKPLSNVDTAWLRMESPTNMMMITGVMVYGAPLDMARVKHTVNQRLLIYDRFKQRVVQSATPMETLYWEDDPFFDLDNHLKEVWLPVPGDQAALQNLTSELMSTQLDFNRPLWQFHIVQGYGEGSAVIARLHHCIADGIALMQVLLSLTDTNPDCPPRDMISKEIPVGKAPEYEPTPWRPALAALERTTRVTETLIHEGMESLLHPSHAVYLSRVGMSGAAALARLVLRYPDPKTIFKGKLGTAKRAVWSAPVPLDQVKTIGRVIGGTV